MRPPRIRCLVAAAPAREPRRRWYGLEARRKLGATKCYRIYPSAAPFSTLGDGGLAVACLTLDLAAARCARTLRPAQTVGLLRGRYAIFHSMKRNRLASALVALLGLVCTGQTSSVWAQAPLPFILAQGAPPAPGGEAPQGPGPARGDLQRDVPRNGWRSLSPAQREAIRRLSQEEREALINRGGGRLGGAAPPGARLSPQERRQLREQIREEHERRGGGFGRGRRP